MTRLRVAALLVLVAAVAGCGKSGPSARVKGKVTYKGQPVTAGAIYFKYDQGQYERFLKDGEYEFSDLPTGPVKVIIETETYNPSQQPPQYGKGTAGKNSKKVAEGIGKGLSEYDQVSGGGAMAGATGGAVGAPLSPERKEELSKLYVKIPTRYGNPLTTPLTFTVENGSQVKDFELTD